MLPEHLNATLELLKSGNFNLSKATFTAPTSATTGLQIYDLEQPGKMLIPIILPLLKSTPRSGGGKSIQANWEVVTAQNSGNLTAGVPEGKRNGTISYARTRYNAVYKTLTMEGSATIQATLASKGFELPGGGDDVRGLSRTLGLNSLFLEQERNLFGGNTTNTGILFNGTGGATATPAPVLTNSASTGGTIGTDAYVRVVPLTVEGLRQTTVSATGVVGQRTVSPADGGSTYTVNTGNGKVSNETHLGSMTGSTNIVTATWADVPGAAGYAVFSGSTTGAANQYITEIVFVNKAVITALGVNTNQAANAAAVTSDFSQDQYVYDGMYTQTISSNLAGTGGYYKSLDAGTLTADGKGGIQEFTTFFMDRYSLFKFTEFEIHVGGNQLNNINQKIRQGTTSTPVMITLQDGKADLLGGGTAVGYVHPLTGKKLPLVLNPNVPDGVIFFKGTQLPAYFLNSNVTNIWEVGERLSYMSFDWPLTTWEYKSAVLVDEVLKGYVPFGNGVISNVSLG